MKHWLLVALGLTAALTVGMLFIARHSTPSLAIEPPRELAALPEQERSAVKLSYVELEASPHRNELPGATQVFGWLVRADDRKPVRGGSLVLRVFDYADSEESATEAHARALAGARVPPPSQRKLRVQEDGGWYLELPGKAWIDAAEYAPDRESADSDRPEAGAPALAHTGAGIDLPLERGALELSFRVDVAVDARGIVVDEQGNAVENALVTPRMFNFVNHSSTTARDGGFVISGIAPQDLIAEHGLIEFQVQAEGFEPSRRLIAWEPGQTYIRPFRVLLKSSAR